MISDGQWMVAWSKVCSMWNSAASRSLGISLICWADSFEQGTLPQFSCPGAHAQNGVAERDQHHLLEAVLALMIVASLPPHFWVEVVSTSTYLININPSSALQADILLERLFGHSPDYSTLHLFGCICFFLPLVNAPN